MIFYQVQSTNARSRKSVLVQVVEIIPPDPRPPLMFHQGFRMGSCLVLGRRGSFVFPVAKKRVNVDLFGVRA